MASLTAFAASEAARLVDEATADPSNGIPGVVVLAIDRNGRPLFSHASGQRSVSDNSKPMTIDSTFWLASFTKNVTAIAAMQLYEQGKLDLDSVDHLEQHVPEVARVQILTGFDEEGKPQYQTKKNKITARMLLTHTSGYGYNFWNENLRQLGEYHEGKEEFSKKRNFVDDPLIFEPGTDFAYGVGIDLVGLLVESISGMRLHQYCERYIFGPLDIKNIGFYLNDKMKDSMVAMHARIPTGQVITIDHPFSIRGEPTPEGIDFAGGGLFSCAEGYTDILSMYLNNGVSPKNGNRILKSTTVDYMFQNHTSSLPLSKLRPRPSAILGASNTFESWTSAPEPHWWGLASLVTGPEVPGGRGKETAEWAGLANCYWLCDRQRGIAMVYLSQIFPFRDVQSTKLRDDLESVIFSGLQHED